MIRIKTRWQGRIILYVDEKSKVYLTLKKEATQKFRRDDLIGKKNFIKCEFIKVTKVPQYKLLNVKNILDFASAHIAIDQYLLEYDYHKELNKEFYR